MQLTSGERLKGALMLAEMSGAELAEYAGCSRQFIHQLIKGQVRTCRPELAHKIETVLSPPLGERGPDFRPLFVERQAPTRRRKRSKRVAHPSKTVVGASDTAA
jgi:transcriptional regulator with XRE-family HTH domain